MPKLKFILPCILLGGFLIGYGIVYASDEIPGVTRPFDPDNYYSPTTVSEADSAPSPFALREISQGDVFDPLRKIKSALFSADYHVLDGLYDQITQNILKDMTPFNKSVLGAALEKYGILHTTTQNNLLDAQGIESTLKTNLFRSADDFTDDGNSLTFKKVSQMKWQEDTYGKLINAAANGVNDTQAEYDALQAAQQNSANAEGDVQALQATAQLRALQEEARARRNMLYANYTAVEAIHNAGEVDERLEAADTASKVQMYAADPSNLTNAEKKIIESDPPKGMPSFH